MNYIVKIGNLNFMGFIFLFFFLEFGYVILFIINIELFFIFFEVVYN